MLHQCLVRLKQPFIKMVPVPKPLFVVGLGKTADIAAICLNFKIHRPFVVTDTNIFQLGLLNGVLTRLANNHIQVSIFNEVESDPSYATVRSGVTHYNKDLCDGVIAIGGGSVIDCAKAIAACVVTKSDVADLVGLLTVRRPLMPIIAVPTTAGTGSECTVAAVLTDNINNLKHVITDPFLVPKIAIIDPLLMLGLPAKETAETGIDALTHAIESYLSLYSTRYTKELSIISIRRIVTNLEAVFIDGNDQNAREYMAIASYQAGLAFTRTYIGYVHAIAHQLGAKYHVPHGRANAVVLTKVLRFYHSRSCQRLTRLAHDLDFVDSMQLIETLETLLDSLSIAPTLPELQSQDISTIARGAIKEAFGVYPVPIEMTVTECKAIVASLLTP